MADKKTEHCGPSQVTINIGASGVTINDEGKLQSPAVDLSAYVTRKAADAAYATKSQVNGMGDSIRATRNTAEQTRADAAKAAEVAGQAEALTQQLARNMVRFAPVVRLDAGQPVPAGTPLGAIIVRSADPVSASPVLFPPISEWPKVSAAEAGDGVRLDFQYPVLAPGLDQLKSSEGTWHLTVRYSYPGGNFGEEEGQAALYTARRFQESGHPAQVDQGAKITDLIVRKGDHQVLELDIRPREVDPSVGDVWGIWLEAPIPSLTVHDVVLRRTV